MSTIFFHVGAHKTGSTFFQDFCATNRQQLLLAGIYYIVGEVLDGNNLLYGNGRVLYEFLRHSSLTGRLRLDGITRILNDYGCSSGSDVLISDEDLAGLNAEGWADIRESCYDLGYSIRIIFVIREPVSYFESLYSHCVRSHCEVRSPYKFVSEESWMHIHNLNSVGSIFCGDEIVVKPYQKDILGLMSGVLSIDLLGPSFIKNNKFVNSRLSSDEIDMALRANRAGIGWIVREMLDYLSDRRFNSTLFLDFSGNADILRSIRDRYSEDIGRLNKSHFNHDPVNWPLDAEYKVENIQGPAGQAIDSGYDFMLSKLSDFESRYHALLLSSIRARLGCLIAGNREGIPEDFSPIEYLLLNRDVLFAGADPFEHYLAWGLNEGRKYKI